MCYAISRQKFTLYLKMFKIYCSISLSSGIKIWDLFTKKWETKNTYLNFIILPNEWVYKKKISVIKLWSSRNQRNIQRLTYMWVSYCGILPSQAHSFRYYVKWFHSVNKINQLSLNCFYLDADEIHSTLSCNHSC